MVGEGRPPVSGGQHQHQHSPSHHQANSGLSTTTTSGRPPLPHSMREAQYLSGVATQHQQSTSNMPSQLDPGSLYDTSRRGGNSGRSNNGRAGGANSLLKQAIANRLKPNAELNGQAGRIDGNDGLDESMTKSIVMNPAWYRDDDGRTGFKTREWEDVPNLQKDQVKMKKKSKRDYETEESSGAIDPELWKLNDNSAEDVDHVPAEEKEVRRKRHRSKDSSQKLQEAMDTLEVATEPQETPDEKKKLTKEEKKILKEKEKEEKKEREEREKEEKRQAKEDKKKEKEREKEEKKIQKLEKKNKSQTSINKVEDDPEVEKKKSKSSSSSAKAESNDKNKEEKPKDEREPRKSKSRRSESSEKTTAESKAERSKSDESRKASTSTEKRTKSSETEDRNKIRSSSKSADSSSKLKSPVVRQDSTESVASSTKSTNTVREASAALLSPKTHRKPPSGRSTLSSPLTSTSSPEEEKTTSSRTVSRDRRPRKETIGDRRDSSVSESSRISAVSHKSVTFCDRIQTHEIERLEFSSSEDDAAVMSDDEMNKPEMNKRRQFTHLLQKRQMDEMNRPQSLPMYNEDDDFEEQERRVEQMLEMGQIPQGYPIYNVVNPSDNGFYAEDEHEHEEEEGTYISLDHLPATVRRAIEAEMQQRDIRGLDCPPMGSMTRLHDPESSPSLLSYAASLPRSASGYLEQEEELMSRSYQNAMYGTAFHHSSSDAHASDVNDKPKSPISQFDRQRRLQESFYDNVHDNPSRTNSLMMPNSSADVRADRRNSDIPKHSESTLQSEDKRSILSIERANFFDSTSAAEKHDLSQQIQTPTPSPPRLIGAPPPNRLLLTSTTTTTSTKTNRTQIVEKTERPKQQNENEMKRQFLAKFGSRRAPIAEEDPTDPVHPMGSQESVLSTDSRESVVSAASIKTETTVRRNFNY